jgi:adenosylcobyric acid synthase
MPARAIMLQGTASNVGKSLLVAGLARALTLRGMSVRPFKPQNMSNNAAVTVEGGEIGRAQALQARAARVAPSVHMNPVLLKPQSETGAQIIVQGKVYGSAAARDFQAVKPKLLPQVLASFATLKAEADIVLVEGAGSASELNLRKHDIANMGFARAAGVPVVVIGDIDRGGVIASLVGTKAVLAPDDEMLVAGFIVNRMRGDLSLFAEGMEEIARRTGWPALGLVPFFDAARSLPSEDAYDLSEREQLPSGGRIKIVAPLLPRIANFDDLDPLAAEPDVELILAKRGSPLPACDLIILPGSKATIADLPRFGPKAGTSTSPPMSAAAGRCSGCAGDIRCLGRASPIREDWKGRPARLPGSACWTSRPRSPATRLSPRRPARPSPTAFPSRDMRCIWARPPVPMPVGRSSASPTAAPTERSRRMGVLPGPMYMGSSPTTGSGRRGSSGSAAGHRREVTSRGWKRPSMRSPPISKRMSMWIVYSS